MALLGKIALYTAGTFVVAGAILCSEGFVHVDVRETRPETHHIFVVAPAMLVPICLHFVPAEKLQDASQRLRPWMPAIRAATESLEEQSDMTIVEVSEPGQHVAVKKEGWSIVVDVMDSGDVVHVSVPVRAIAGTLEEISSSQPEGQS
ncbi:MAG TPA: hypothetical protein VMU43_11635 [Candidatus Acidoferrum sp.]|nr:hypothetical protein [Candidatus Acidoferrum sp.]